MSQDDNKAENVDKNEKVSDILNENSLENLKECGVTEPQNKKEPFYCLTIIGQIEGHYVLDGTQKTTKYDHMIPLLISLEQNEDIKGILILLNTMGGDVEAGLAMAEVIASLKKPTVSVVLGGGHSIGVPLAVSAKKSFIVPSATMTVHPVRTTGTIISSPQSFDYLQKMQSRIVNFVTSHSHIQKEVLEKMMMRTDQMANDIGSVIDGTEAVACGLIDEIGGIKEALEELKSLSEDTE